MMRKLVIFNDHSWTKPQQRSGNRLVNGNATIASICLTPEDDNGVRQISFLQSNQQKYRPFRDSFRRITGLSLRREVLEAYRFIVKNYMPGDEIFLIGAGRGGYAMQCLSELLGISGLLHIDSYDNISEAYTYSRLTEKARSGFSGKELRAKFNARTVPVRFMGTWDPVGQDGAPTHILKPLTRLWSEYDHGRICNNTKSVYQAFALDENNSNFKPNILLDLEGQKPENIEQVWFAGKHANVTGGQRDSRLSDITLRWLIGRAMKHGLKFDQDKLNNLTSANPLGSIAEDQWQDRLMALFTKTSKVRPIGKADAAFSRLKIPGTEKIHISVKSKLRKESHYQPASLGNLPLGAFPICKDEDLPQKFIRKFERLPVNCPATLLVSSRRFNGNMLDFSEGGAKIWSPMDLPIGTQVTVRSSLLIDNQKTGHVVWIKNQSLGLEFGDELEFENIHPGNPTSIQ